MDCTNCGTWNPDDKDVCWRCQTELPRPVEKKRRQMRRIGGLPIWFWAAIAIFFLVSILGQCMVTLPG